MVRSEFLLAAVGALLLAVAAAAPASAPSTAGEGQGGALAATPAKYGNGTDLQKAVPENTPAKNIAPNLDSTVDLSATTSSSVTGGESGLPPLPKEHEPTPEEIAEFEALFSKGKQSEEVSEETSKEKRKRERKEKKKRMEQEKKEEEERERREKEEKKKRREQEKKEEEERERRENEEREKEEKVVEERVKEKKVKEEHERKEQEREPEEEREKEKKLEEERVKEKEVEEVHERKQQGNNDDVDILQREGKQKQDDTEKNSNDENTGEGSSSSEGSSVTADTPIASKSVQSELGVSESSSPLVSAVAQPQPLPQPQAAAWTAASSWGPAPASQGSAAQPASSGLGQPRSASQTFNIISSSPISYPGTASQSVAPPTVENSGRYTFNVSPPPVPREKIISSYLRDVFQFSDTKQLLDSLKNGQPLQPQDYKGVTVNLKVTGYDGKPVVNQVGPWTSRPYTAPPAPSTPAAPAPTFAPAAPAAATPNAALQDVTYPLYFLNFQGRQLPVYDSNVDTAKVLAQLEQLNQIHQQQQETLRQLREQMQQELQLAQQPTLYHRPPVDPSAKDTQVIQVPVPTELESVEGSSGKILQPIKTSQAILTIPSSPDQQLVERGLGSASSSLLQPIPASGPVFSIQGPMTVVANQGAHGPSPAWQSYSSPGLSSGASATPSSVYNAAGAAAASPASHAPYKGVLTPGVPASLDEYAKSLAAGGAPSGSADNAPSSGAASSVTYSAASSSSSGAATSGSPDPLAQLKSQPTAGGSSSSSASLASPNRITFTIPGANFVPSSTQYSQYSSAPQQVFTFTSSAAAPGTANYLVPGTIPDVSATGTSGVLRQLPAGYQTTFLAPTQQQQQQTTTWAQRQPYTVSVYATQTKS